MIGVCPNCKISLKDPPFVDDRETNEVMTTMIYRKLIESGEKIKSLNEVGYCPVCKATKKHHEEQKRLLNTIKI